MTDRDNQTNFALARMIDPSIAEMQGKTWISDDTVRQFIRFDAIHSGADFDAVLMWARMREPYAKAVLWVFADNPYEDDTEFRRAVCEAIVEAGDDLL